MTRFLAVFCLALAVAAPAGSKGFSFRICGATGCKPLPADASLAGLYGSRGIAAPARPGPWFEVRAFADGGRELGRWAYVPGERAIWRRFTTWTRLEPREDAGWQRAVRGLAPFRAPAVRAATLGGVPVKDPASYLAIYGGRAQVTSFSGDPLPLVLLSGRQTPWTGRDAAADFYPREGVVVTAGTILVLPHALAERLRSITL